MCTQRGELSRRGILLRSGALAALGLVPALGCAHGASARGGASQAERPAVGPPYGRPLGARYPVTAGYGIPGDWLAGHHTGIDFAVPEGTRTYSVGTGVVEIADQAEESGETDDTEDTEDAAKYGPYGNAVMLRMDDGHFVLYAHLSKVSVERAAQVRAGTYLGDTGATGRVTGPHLHFEVRTTREYGTDVDPAGYLAERGIQLL